VPEVSLSSFILSVRRTQIPLKTVAIGAGTLLPYLAARDRRLLKPQTSRDDDDDEDEDEEIENIRAMVREWKAEAARHGRPLKLPTSELQMPESLIIVPFMLRNIWTAGLVLFGLVMGSTFFITKVWQVSTTQNAAETRLPWPLLWLGFAGLSLAGCGYLRLHGVSC